MHKLTKLLSTLLLVLIVALAAIFLYIDRLARIAVETSATYALGVPTSLDSADVKILASQFAMAGLTVANPEGYSAEHFVKLNDGSVALALFTLTKQQVDLPHLTLDGVDMHLQKKDGKANYKVILESLKRFESAGSPPAEGEGKKYVVGKLTITNVNVHLNLVGSGDLTKVDVPIDRIEMENVGSDGSGINMSRLISVILKAVLAAVVQKGGDLIPDDIGNELKGALAQLESLAEVADIGALADFGSKTVGEVADAAGSLGDKTKDGADKVISGIGGLLGGNKDKKE